jgi:ComF family protein
MGLYGGTGQPGQRRDVAVMPLALYVRRMDGEDVLAPPTGSMRHRPLAGRMLKGLVDIALPSHCLACDRRVADAGTLCASCWSGLKLIDRPYCERLGTPFTYELGEGALSAEAIADPPPFGRCRAVAAFDDVSRRLVHGLKYRDRLDLAMWMANWMMRSGTQLIADCDVIVPVPLHRRRLWSRRFNQSGELAKTVARSAGKPFEPSALTRVRATRHQVGLSAGERDRNVRGAFRVAADARVGLAGQRVLLIDDVYTTGATVKAAARALLRAGAASVDVLVFARVVRPAG